MEDPSPTLRERPGAAAPRASARAPGKGEHAALLAWLDDGLRRGRRGRLAAEYPLSLAPERRRDQRVVYTGDEPLAHAMLHEVVVRAGGRRLRAGLIGLVYTAAAARGRGLAPHCIDACLGELARRGVPLALLWSERHAFYRRLGFEGVGVEERLRASAALCRRARAGRKDDGAGWRVETARPDDFAALEALYRAKPVARERPPGALARLAAAPETELVVARRGGRARGYAALGRGDDFAGVIHEWAGEPDAVLACWQDLCERRAGRGALEVAGGPVREAPLARLREAGAATSRGCFALARILDPAALWSAAVGDGAPGAGGLPALGGRAEAPVLHTARGPLRLGPGEALALLFGPRLPLRAGGALGAEGRRRLAGRLPFPLYLWGFDSI